MGVMSDQELRLIELERNARKHAYDLVHKLTFFVISIELIFCGYILLNAEEFGVIKHLSLLFLLGGVVAISGLLWRFFYNQQSHDMAHGRITKRPAILQSVQYFLYWIFVIGSVVFFIFSVGAGYRYLNQIENQSTNRAISKTAEPITVIESEWVGSPEEKINIGAVNKEDPLDAGK